MTYEVAVAIATDPTRDADVRVGAWALLAESEPAAPTTPTELTAWGSPIPTPVLTVSVPTDPDAAPTATESRVVVAYCPDGYFRAPGPGWEITLEDRYLDGEWSWVWGEGVGAWEQAVHELRTFVQGRESVR